MCNFFSFVATKDKLHAYFSVDSHEDIIILSGLKHLDKRDTQLVRCEVTPNDPMTLDFEKWTFKVDQDLRPDWFFEDEWRERAIEYLKNAPVITKPIKYFASQAYFATARVNRLLGSGCICFLLGDAQIGEMWDSSQVGEMLDSSQVGDMWCASQVSRMLDSSQVSRMWGSSQVGEMLDLSKVSKMWGSSQVGEMLDSSQVGKMWNLSQVGGMWGSSQVGGMWGSSQVGEMWDSSKVGIMRDSSRIIEDNRIKQKWN